MQKQLELIICQGLPGSGKSTWSRAWVEESPKTRVRVNRDDIRFQLGPYWIPSREKLVTIIENSIIIESLFLNYSVVVDATNLKGIQRFSNLVKGYGNNLNIIIQSFLDVPIEECIRRDSLREKHLQVGPEIIKRMFNSIKK